MFLRIKADCRPHLLLVGIFAQTEGLPLLRWLALLNEGRL